MKVSFRKGRKSEGVTLQESKFLSFCTFNRTLGQWWQTGLRKVLCYAGWKQSCWNWVRKPVSSVVHKSAMCSRDQEKSDALQVSLSRWDLQQSILTHVLRNSPVLTQREAHYPLCLCKIFQSCLLKSLQVMSWSSPNELIRYDKSILKVTVHDPILSWRKVKQSCSVYSWWKRGLKTKQCLVLEAETP